MKVEPAFHEISGGALQVAPFVGIGEARGGYPSPCRYCPERLAIRFLERAIDRLEFIILIFAQACLRAASAIMSDADRLPVACDGRSKPLLGTGFDAAIPWGGAHSGRRRNHPMHTNQRLSL